MKFRSKGILYGVLLSVSFFAEDIRLFQRHMLKATHPTPSWEKLSPVFSFSKLCCIYLGGIISWFSLLFAWSMYLSLQTTQYFFFSVYLSISIMNVGLEIMPPRPRAGCSSNWGARCPAIKQSGSWVIPITEIFFKIVLTILFLCLSTQIWNNLSHTYKN